MLRPHTTTFKMAESQNQSNSFAFPKAQKLCGQTTIDRLFRDGQGFARFPLRVVYIVNDEPRQGEAPLRMMVSVGKKKFKRAVKRNRVKRLVRETWRLRKHAVEDALDGRGLHVAFLFLSSDLPTYDEIDSAMSKAVDRLVNEVRNAIRHEKKG